MTKKIIVTTKSELKKAKSRGVSTIIVNGDLAKKLNLSKKVTYLGPVAMVALTTTVAGIVAAPATGGLGFAVSGFSAITVATITGMELATIIFVSTMGIGFIISIFKGYDSTYENGKLILKKIK